MASDMLQPAFLDRITDHNPSRSADTVAELTISRRQLRQIILRDLSWLLNVTNMESEVDFVIHEHARRSAVNFGLPAFSGRRISDVKKEELESSIKEAITVFEPRILPGTLEVNGLSDSDYLGAHNLLMFEIRGQIWATPYPIEMLVKSSIDLETGAVTLQDQLGDN